MAKVTTDIAKAADLLIADQVVAIPTETVYGLAGNIYSSLAIQKIFEIKKRPKFNPLIVHVSSIAQAIKITKEFPEKAKILAENFWPGPLTLVLDKNPMIPDLVSAGKQSVAIRIPNHPTTLSLLEKLPFPLAAPSANPFNRISPTKAKHVADYFDSEIPLILDGGNCQRGIESTIIGFEKEAPVVYRLGSLALEEIENLVGEVRIKNQADNSPSAPGMLKKHYAPKTKSILVEDAEKALEHITNEHVGIITFDRSIRSDKVKHQIVLSETGDFREAAANLYDALHIMDEMELDLIIAEQAPNQDLGKSINDRLSRATQ